MFQKQQYYKTESLKYEVIPGNQNVSSTNVPEFLRIENSGNV